MRRIQAAIASWAARSRDSLPSDQAITDGWDRSRSTIREAAVDDRGEVPGVVHTPQRAWRLDVRLVDHVQPELVAQVVERSSCG